MDRIEIIEVVFRPIFFETGRLFIITESDARDVIVKMGQYIRPKNYTCNVSSVIYCVVILFLWVIQSGRKSTRHHGSVVLITAKFCPDWKFAFNKSNVDHLDHIASLLRHVSAGMCRDDVIKWKHFPRYWPFVRGIHRSPAKSPHKGQWRGTLMFPLNGWVNNGGAGDLRRHQAHYDVTVMFLNHL